MVTICREFFQGVWLGCQILIAAVSAVATVLLLSAVAR